MDRESLVENLLTSLPMIYKKVMRGLPSFGISKQQMKLLAHINEENGRPMKYYSDRMMIPKSNLTVIADKLIEEGLLERKLEPNDRRVITLKITDKGKEQLLKFRKILKEEMLKKLEVLDDEDIRKLNKLIKEIVVIFEKAKE